MCNSASPECLVVVTENPNPVLEKSSHNLQVRSSIERAEFFSQRKQNTKGQITALNLQKVTSLVLAHHIHLACFVSNPAFFFYLF